MTLSRCRTPTLVTISTRLEFRTPYVWSLFVAMIRTAGNPGRNDLDETQELYYPAICRAIAADYDGYE